MSCCEPSKIGDGRFCQSGMSSNAATAGTNDDSTEAKGSVKAILERVAYSAVDSLISGAKHNVVVAAEKAW